MIRAAAVLAVMTLGGCASSPVVLERRLADRIPRSLLTCASRPVAGELTRQSDVAGFVVDLDAAGQDCRRKVDAIRGIVEADGPETNEARRGEPGFGF